MLNTTQQYRLNSPSDQKLPVGVKQGDTLILNTTQQYRLNSPSDQKLPAGVKQGDTQHYTAIQT